MLVRRPSSVSVLLEYNSATATATATVSGCYTNPVPILYTTSSETLLAILTGANSRSEIDKESPSITPRSNLVSKRYRGKDRVSQKRVGFEDEPDNTPV